MKYFKKQPTPAEKRIQKLNDLEHQIKQLDKDIVYFTKFGTQQVASENVTRLKAEKATLLKEVEEILRAASQNVENSAKNLRKKL
jgi:uncharacterized protein YdcH (DUF465 family)